MTRYFQSAVTGRPFEAGGRSFIFEPVEPMGGSWLGVLAVDDESAASILSTSEGAWEITQEKFDALKKKRSGAATDRGLPPSPSPQPRPQPLEGNVAHVVLPGDRPEAAGNSSAGDAPAGSIKLASVELLTTALKPPAEPLLEAGAPKRRKAA